jgi:hypothetical protein
LAPPPLKHNAPICHFKFASQIRQADAISTWQKREFCMIRSLLLIASLSVVGSSGVLADPRQDTLAGISRCAGMPDDRTFLDCVYGAAQPLRAELGLPPAPAFQTRLVPPAPLQAPPAPAPRAPSLASAPTPQNTNGLFGNLFNGATEETLPMASYSFNPRGLFTVTLSDGQVWRQSPSDTEFANWSGSAQNYYVTVRAQPTGGFSLSVRGADGIYRVERVR